MLTAFHNQITKLGQYIGYQLHGKVEFCFDINISNLL